MTERPAILFINTDQLRPDFLGCYGFGLPTSPCIDRLAAEGTRFANTFCQAPLCVPGRYSMITGQYVRNHGAIRNSRSVFPGIRSLAEEFARNDYHTAAVGKLHHNPPGDPFGYRDVFLHDALSESSWDRSVYVHWLRERGVDPAPLAYPADIDTDPRKRRLKDKVHWGPARLTPDLHETTFLADRASAYVRDYDRQEPLFLYLSFFAPHSPYHPPPPYDTLFAPASLPAAAVESEEQAARKSPVVADAARFYLGEEGLDDGIVAEIRAAYCGVLRLLDENIGRAVEAFRARFGEDALILLTSDHGDFLGDHGRCEKGVCYDTVTRVPHIVCWPGRIAAGAVEEGLTEQIDMFPTLLGCVGAEWDASAVAGKDRSAELLAGSVPGERYVFSENHCSDGLDYSAMVRSERYKLIGYNRGYGDAEIFWEFYDLAEDPDELANRADDPALAEVVETHRRELAEWMIRTKRYDRWTT